MNNSSARRLLPAFVLLGLTAVSACDDGVCNANLVAGLTLSVVDAETGEAVPDPRFSFTIDGEGPETLEDAEPWNGNYDIGYVSGLYEVTIEAEGYEPMSATYDVASNGCDPDTVTATVELVAIVP